MNFKSSRWIFPTIILSTWLLSTSTLAANISMYIDFDQPNGGPGVPLNTYSAAAPTAGTWNGILAKDGVYGSAVAAGALVDISGAALPGVFVDLGGSQQITPNVHAPVSLGTHSALLGDYFDTSLPAPPAWLLQITGLVNGNYDVYVYAPAAPGLPTSGWSFTNGAPQQNISGSTDGVLNAGLDYLFVQTVVANNNMMLSSGLVAGGVAGPSGLAGIQLVQTSAVPLPAAAWLFGSALLGLRAVRRGKKVRPAKSLPAGQ